MERIITFLSGLKITIAGGVFLAVSLVLMLAKVRMTLDPAWITIVLCGTPIFYWAIWCLIYEKGMGKITTSLLIAFAMLASIMLGGCCIRA